MNPKEPRVEGRARCRVVWAASARGTASRAAVLLLACALGGLPIVARADTQASDAKKIYTQRCTACHTYGKGTKVGPDLKGVTVRRSRPWLLQFIRSSQGMVKSGDPIAAGLFRQFQQQRMPDWGDLSDQQIGSLLEWLAADGPDQGPVDDRSAELATPAEIAWGKALFSGSAPLANGNVWCSSCHRTAESDPIGGGNLGPDLTIAYQKYRDRALTLFLRHPCSPQLLESRESPYLTAQEVYAIKAFLRHVAQASTPPPAPSD